MTLAINGYPCSHASIPRRLATAARRRRRLPPPSRRCPTNGGTPECTTTKGQHKVRGTCRAAFGRHGRRVGAVGAVGTAVRSRRKRCQEADGKYRPTCFLDVRGRTGRGTTQGQRTRRCSSITQRYSRAAVRDDAAQHVARHRAAISLRLRRVPPYRTLQRQGGEEPGMARRPGTRRDNGIHRDGRGVLLCRSGAQARPHRVDQGNASSERSLKA